MNTDPQGLVPAQARRATLDEDVAALSPGYRELYDDAGGAFKLDVLQAADDDPDSEHVDEVRERLSIYPAQYADNDPRADGRDPWSTAVGNIETASGRRYSFEDPQPDTILLEDIAHALSNVCRFAGHIRRFNSVAEHSVLVSRIVDAKPLEEFGPAIGITADGTRNRKRDIVRAALLHDAHEAYIWDAPSPVKPLLGDTFKRLGRIADEVIAAKFLREGYSADTFKNPIIKAADRVALVVEGRALLPVGPSDEEWEPLPPGVQWDGGVSSYEAKTMFLQRAKELGL
jgi:uncharacterized protein